MNTPITEPDPSDEFDTNDALTPEIWRTVERRLLAKMLEEFAYEELIEPEFSGNGSYRLDLGEIVYEFGADERLFDSYSVDPDSIRRRADGDREFQSAIDPIEFLLDARERMGVPEMTAGHLVREYRNTLLADAHIEARRRRDPGVDLDDLSYAEIEGEMTGHPWVTYNKGRIGWGYDDYRRYAPESQQPVRLQWVAVSRDLATFVSVDGLGYDALLERELGEQYGEFTDRLRSKGLDPDAYYLLPVHEWQWDEAIVGPFAKEVATNAIVPLGESSEEYLSMQSIRTFANVTDPKKHNVKLPMKILNTLVWRGLPGERTEAAPLVTAYLKGIRDEDPFLRDEHRLVLPGEIAGVNVDHPVFDQLEGSPYQYRELLGCVWRESVQDLIEAGERPITLSALLCVDGTGTPLVSRLVERSGLSLEEWLDELFSTLLPPLLHYLYRYGTVFSPHGENTILVLRDGVPVRLALKDFVDDVNVSEYPLPELEALPEDLKSVLRTEPPEGLSQFVFAGLFVGVFRYLADVLEEHHDYPEERFYQGVREEILDYQSRFPELEERFELFDLLAPTFTKLCLNRNRMFGGYGDAEGRPHAAEHGVVRNALYEVGREDE